jgi:hypothetical protein
MRFQEIPAEILIIRVERTDNAAQALQEQPVLSVAAKTSSLDEFEIRLMDFIVSAKPVIGADSRRLNSELASGRAILAQLANPAADGSIELQVAFFTGECLEMGDIEIGVDEYVENAIAKIERSKDRIKGDQLYRRLDEFCCFHQGNSAFFFLTAGPAIDDALKPEPSIEDDTNKKLEGRNEAERSAETEIDGEPDTVVFDATQTPRLELTHKNSFCVTGDGIRFVASEAFLPGGKSIFIATRLKKHKAETDRALRLAKGNLRFVDWTQAGEVQLLAKAQMTALTKEDGSYLKNWDEFGDVEGEVLLQDARGFGALQYSDAAQNRDGTVSVRISQASEYVLNALTKGSVTEVEIVDELPEYLKNENLSFKVFASGIEEEAEYEKLPWKQNGPQEAKSYFKVLDFDAVSKYIALGTENLPMESGTLILSLAGDIAQIKRRMAARRAILEGRAANPQLGLLIERNGRVAATRLPQKILPLTAFVRDKVFRNPPTVMQQKAIEVALNTPDIAIIQGPPGTGKTTVIAAILERLNEMANKRGVRVKGQILLTGFQHDAVENMIERLTLNSIPVPKFGSRSGAEEGDFSVFEMRLEEWCGKLAAELRKRNPQIAEIEQETEVRNLCLQYVQAPTRALAVNLARRIESLGFNILGEEGVRRASNLLKNLSREEGLSNDFNQTLNVVRRLRVGTESFADDGPERATDALDDLKDDIEENELALLDTASLWRKEDGTPPFLKDLAELKRVLLVRFAFPPVFRVEKKSDEVIAMAEEAIRRIKVAGHSTKDAKSTALAEFLAELETNPYGMMNAVSDYSFAFAATCQQSVNRGMQIQKGITGRNVNDNQKKMEYEYVIVDEAARVSPRDLMVAMVQGKRIILVGDHRQLPHIIDDKVARQMDEGETGDDEFDWLKKSMFQYFFSERLKVLEGDDGITRCVTLDKQYRMHPLLGDFISRNFYERFDPIEKFYSGRPASDFAHNLQAMDGKAAAWLDVKAAMGKHQRSGTSWTRPAEVTAIAHQLQAWMNSDVGEGLTFAVISFYKAQADLIKKQLGRLTKDDKKLRVGTVDSFQGMEFDVVFLSTVRTLPKNWSPKAEDRERQARTLFGHLCLYNRLNVSMSRQKKLLVVAGDSDLLQCDLAAEFIPGMVDFFKLCKEEGKILQCR